MNRKTFLKVSLLICVSLGLVSGAALAQDVQDDDDYDKFRLSLGWFNPQATTTIRLDATNSDLGTTITLEDDVGLTKGNGLFRADGYFRFKKRHQVDFGYYDFDRSGIATISLIINFGDQTFPANALVDSFFDIEIIKFSYTYLFIVNRKTKLGASVGFNLSDVSVGLSAVNMQASQTAGTKLPLPVFGINFSHHLGHHFWFETHVQFFYLKVGAYDGTLFDNRIAINYRIKDNFGIGVGYNFFNFKVNKSNPEFTGRFNLKFDGVQIFASLFF